MGKQTATAADGQVIPLRQRARPRDTGIERGDSRQTLFAQLVLTGPAAERLLRSIAKGTDEYIVTSVDASISARAQVTLSSAPVPRPRADTDAVIIDWAQGTIAHGVNRVSVSRTELRLLGALVDHQGAVVSRDALIARGWPRRSVGVEYEDTLTVYICGLRRRLASIGLGQALETVRGVGYRVRV